MDFCDATLSILVPMRRAITTKLFSFGSGIRGCATNEFQTYTAAEASAYTVAQLVPAVLLLGAGYYASKEGELVVPQVMGDDDYAAYRRDNSKLMKSQEERENAMIEVQRNVQSNPVTKSLLSHWDSSRQVGGKPANGSKS